MGKIGRTTGFSIAEVYIKSKCGKKVTRREMEKFIKHDKASQEYLRSHAQDPDFRNNFMEGVDEALKSQFGYCTRIFTGSFRAAEEVADYKRAQRIRAQIERYQPPLRPPLRPDEILGKNTNDDNR